MLCGLGFDAQVAHDFANDPKRGLATYIRKTVSNFFTAKTYPFVLSAHGRRIKTDALFISIANSNQFGNNFTIAPKASLNDGLLDIVVMAKQNKLFALLQAFRQVGGYNRLQKLEVINENASVLYFQTHEIKIENPQLAPMHIDGDPAETKKKLTIEILKDSFRLISPSVY
jgi:diacylglycerol kinase family enzyme